MKIFKLFLSVSFLLAFALHSNAQGKKVVTDTVVVEGICDMCQKRIEEAAYGSGVKFASWDKQSKQLAVTYRSDKTSIEEIETRIAAAGHKTQNIVAKSEDYEALPGCCKYETGHTH